MVVPRGPSFARTVAAIALAEQLDVKARLEREAAYRQERAEAFRAAERYPLRVALVDPNGRPPE